MDPTITKEQMDEFINIVKPYTVLVVIDGRMNLIGSFSYKSKDEISKKIKIFDSYNNTYYPLKDNEISTDAKDFIELMKPFFSNMLGPFGQNLQFFLFPSENKYKSKMIDVKSNGFFKFEYNNIEYKYRLPLGSLMPQKTCHKCYENFTGNYLYCPWDGNLLK